MPNGSEFKSSIRLKSIRSRRSGNSPTRSQHYGATVKRVKVDLYSPKNRLGSVGKTFDNVSYINTSNIIDDFDSDVD